tara:strand:+ start:5692 stop:5901 length:210 start_codon:yes stop_codon:yes gene_type:complete
MIQMDIDDLEFNFNHIPKKVKFNTEEVGSLESNFSTTINENYIAQQLENLENIAKSLLGKIQDLKYELL